MSIAGRMGAGVAGVYANAVAEALDAQIDALNTVWLAIRSGVDLNAAATPPTWALRIASNLLGVTRDPSWTNEDWLYCLRLRAASRMSHGTNPECVLLAQRASPIGDGTADSGPVAVRFYLAGGLDLSEAQKECVRNELLCAIPDVAGIAILATTIPDAANVFTLDIGPGFDLGALASAL